MGIGESWEFSTFDGSRSRAEGHDLEALLGEALPFLAKLIDTQSALSIQVHPQDDVLTRTGGKEEAWIILEAEPGARVLAGLAEGIDHPQLERRARAAWAGERDAGPNLVEALRSIEVQRGDVVLVPGRTVHAIQGGILLAEIQQPSDCTYRLYDYGSEREIHPEAALATIDPQAQPVCWRAQANQAADAAVVGDRVRLQVGAGPKQVTWSHPGEPALLVCVGDALRLEVGGSSFDVRAGDLRLWLHGDLNCSLPAGGQLVLGRVTP